MFARRLAWQMGELDVDMMLDRLSPDGFDRWWAAYATGQLDDGWQQAAMICAEIRNLPKRFLIHRYGGKLDPKDLAKPRDFLPDFDKRDAQADVDQKRLEAYQKHLAARYR